MNAPDTKALPHPSAGPLPQGWVNVVVAALAMTATLPGRTHGLGLITTPLLAELRIDEPTFSLVNLWAILGGSLLAWPTGWLIDRFGVRWVGCLLTAGLAGAVLAMSQVQVPLQLFLSLWLVRGLGQGALSMVSMAMVGKWFRRRLGPAMAVYSVLLGIGFIASTLLVGKAVQDHGWRDSWIGLGVALMVLAGLTWLLVRDDPTGGEPEPAKEANTLAISAAAPDATLAEALLSPAFWTFSLAAAGFGMIWSAITLYNQKILQEQGFGADDFLLVMSLLAGVGLLSNLAGGWLSMRWPLGRILALGMLPLAGALAAFPMIHGQAALVGYALTLGLAGGLITVVYFTFYGRAFGRRRLGMIQGAAHLLSTVASALGPVLLTWRRAASGSYDEMFLFTAPILALLGLAAWMVPTPERLHTQESHW